MPDVPTSNPDQFFQGAPLFLVPDVSATADFYRRILGFKADPGADSPEYSVVWRDNAAVHLAKGENAPTGVRVFFLGQGCQRPLRAGYRARCYSRGADWHTSLWRSRFFHSRSKRH